MLQGASASVGALFVVAFKHARVTKLRVEVRRDLIIVTTLGFYVAYSKRPNKPQLIIKRRTDTNDHELLAQAWQAASDKARELGWIV